MPETPPPLLKSDQNLVWLDCEMSGLDPERERLLEIAVIITGPNLEPRIEGPVLVLWQNETLLDQMDAWNKGTHGKSQGHCEGGRKGWCVHWVRWPGESWQASLGPKAMRSGVRRWETRRLGDNVNHA